MKKTFLFLLLCYFFISVRAQHPGLQHPEKGILPYNAPCSSCVEEMEKRTANSREFYSYNSDGSKSIFIQKSLGEMNFKDKEGFWRAKDPRVIQESKNVYAARMQPHPVVIDFEQKFSSISSDGKEFRFNKNISLVHIADDGSETSLGPGNWGRITRTENFTETIFLIEEFYPGIDLQMITNCGSVKTNFILKNKLLLSEGWLALRQEIVLPSAYSADLSASSLVNESMRAGELNFQDETGKQKFTFKRSHAYDSQNRTFNFMEMPFKLDANILDYNVPVSWLDNPETVYPVTLDPLVYSGDTLSMASILGSGWTPVCGTQGCSYFLNNVMTPPNCEINKITTYFSYQASLPCLRDDGGFDITMTNPYGDSCVSQNLYCPGSIQGQCFFWPMFLYNFQNTAVFGPCLLPPQCASYDLDFKLMFRRCNQLQMVPCDNSCIASNSDWIINIEGRTVELTNVILPQIICEGECATLAATADWGVPLVIGTNVYTFTWNDSIVGDQISVCPDSSTQYVVVVTDLCGVTDTGYTDITVITCTDIDKITDPVSGIIPNPAKDYIKINFAPAMKSKSIVITNEIGELVYEKNGIEGNEVEIDVSKFSKGIYLLKANNGLHSGTHKIIIH
jgi:hypothetical protein